ncbi:hypothetical protein J7M07_08265, partial [bacterium]|nr:hypothetical protein [bacterium]
VKLKLHKNSIVSCTLPFRFCDFEYGKKYDIVLWSDRYERREGRFAARSGDEISICGKKMETCLKNAILPGYGTYLRERKKAATIDLLATAGSLYKLYEEMDEYNELKDRLNGINISLAQEEIRRNKISLQIEAHKASIDVNLQNHYRKKLMLFSAALYAYQLIEPIFMDNPPEINPGLQRNNIEFKAIDRSISKALFYSFLRPGRGQFYQGKEKRGVFFSSMVILSGFLSLDLNNQYNKNVNDYNFCMDKFNSASIEDKKIYGAEASLLWEKVEDSRNKRNLSIYVLTGLWGWNVIDTLFPGDKSCSTKNYSLNVTPLGCKLAINF